MSYYLIFIAILLMEGIVFIYWKPKAAGDAEIAKRQKVYLGIVMIELILLSGLRSFLVGADTNYYIEYFQEIDNNYSWPHMFRYIFGEYWTGNAWFEPAYSLYVKLVHIFTDNGHIFLIITAVCLMVPLCKFIYQNSADMSMSFMIYMCLFFQCFGITAIRQAMALSIAVLFGFQFVKERKLCKFLLCMAVAILFHKSALIFLPFYFLYPLTMKKSWRVMYLFIAGFVMVGRDWIVKLACQIMDYGYTGFEGEKAFNMVIIMAALTVFILWKYDSLVAIREDNRGYINAILVGTLILPFTQIDSTYMRLCYYYYMFLMLIIPEILKLFPKKWAVVFRICGYAGMILLFARHGLEYQFFWQV